MSAEQGTKSTAKELEEKSATIEELVGEATKETEAQAAPEDAEAEADEADAEGAEDDSLQVPPVEIRIVAPTNTRTLPARPSATGSYQSLTLLPQAHETIQELKLAINEFVGGYWLGPYSLRIPIGHGRKREQAAPSSSAQRDGIVEVKEGDKLSDWLEVGHVFADFETSDKRVLEVYKEPYSEFSARQTVLRLVELLSPSGTEQSSLTSVGLNPGATIFESVRDGTASAPAFREVEVALPGKKSKGKKEVIKVKQEGKHAFADWKGDWIETDLATIPITQQASDWLPCLKQMQLSPFNPPPPHLKQLGHQLYLLVTTLEGDNLTLICSSRGWYVSRSTTSSFDPSPRSQSPPVHSLIDLLHSLSPLFTERLSRLQPLSTTPPAQEPIATVPIPQTEPAFPFLTSSPRSDIPSDLIKTQLAYLHTGATTADGLDGARDWNEELQGIRELPRKSMQERVMREKIAQKTFAEFTAASVRGVLTVARGDIPPLNPTEDPRAHMYLISNIFITKAVDSSDAYAHLGGDAAAHVSHGKDAAGVKILNKLDIDGVHLLGHTVIDWAGERWICQSMLPGIFSRRAEEPVEEQTEGKAEEAQSNGESSTEKKDDWVQVNGSPSKSETKGEGEDTSEELAENPLIIHGFDSEQTSSIHWDAPTHKVMSKVATATRLALHKMKDGSGKGYEFYASAEVKALCGNDGRRYLLDLPRLSPVDVEWLEKDVDGKLIGSEVDAPQYPHRLVLLRPELVETFWENELKRWARSMAAKQKAEADEKKGESSSATEEKDKKAENETPITEPLPEEAGSSTAAGEAAARRAEADAPLGTTLDASSLADFKLVFNPDAFADQPFPKGDSSANKSFTPSEITDESDPSVKAVRDASLFLRQVAVPAMVLDALTGNLSGVMDGWSLSRAMHTRGINMRYLGYLVSTIDSFTNSSTSEQPRQGPLHHFRALVVQEMVLRAAKHVIRSYLTGLVPEHAQCATSHILNCLLGTGANASPEPVYHPLELNGETQPPAYTSLTPESLRNAIVEAVRCRFRWQLADTFFEKDLKKPQFLRELATRVGFQLSQRAYVFEGSPAEQANGHVETATPSPPPAAPGKKDKKKNKDGAVKAVRTTTFEPSDVLTLLPIIKSTAPSCTVASEIFDAGRATIARGNTDLGLDFLLEAVQLYENVHSVIHPEVASTYNEFASTVHQLARLKIQQLAGENADPNQPLGLDLATALRLQRQAVIIAERTLGIYHPETCTYYFNLAMLEHLEGNTVGSLRYFRHVLEMWDVILGPGHPEINTILSNVGVVLQSMGEHQLSLSVLLTSYNSTVSIFGDNHIQTAQSLHQLTQAHFLAGDIESALSSAKSALPIFEKSFGKEHVQTKEVAKNIELLSTVADTVERQKELGAQQRERQLERLRAAQGRVGSGVRRRLGQTLPSSSSAAATTAGGSKVLSAVNGNAAVNGVTAEPASKIGARGHLDVDELVHFIQGGESKTASTTGGAATRAKHSLRGKRRTGAKR